MSAAKRLHRLHWLLMERNPRSNTSTSRSCKNVAARRLEKVIPKQRRAYTGEGVTRILSPHTEIILKAPSPAPGTCEGAQGSPKPTNYALRLA